MSGGLHKIAKRGALFYVVDDHGKATGIGYARREDAEDSLSYLLRSSRRTIRTCMSFQKPFESEGTHNCMCPRCKSRGGWVHRPTKISRLSADP